MRSAFRGVSAYLIAVPSLFLYVVATSTHAHELMENRAALALRDDRLVSTTLYLNIGEVLHKVLRPKEDRFEHTAGLAAMSDVDFGQQFSAAKKAIQSGIVIKSVRGKPLKISNWQWPEAGLVQKYLREITMQVVVTPGSHFHETPIEVRALIQSDEPISSLRVEMLEALRPITLIATRPKQGRLNSTTPSLVIDF
jgi:hypothetical protein